jgi:hypothetical protein
MSLALSRRPSQEWSKSGEPRHSLRQRWRTTYPIVFPVLGPHEWSLEGIDQSGTYLADLSDPMYADLRSAA